MSLFHVDTFKHTLLVLIGLDRAHFISITWLTFNHLIEGFNDFIIQSNCSWSNTFTRQILLTQDSARVHREVLKNMPILRRLSRAKLDDQQVKLMGNILDDLAE